MDPGTNYTDGNLNFAIISPCERSKDSITSRNSKQMWETQGTGYEVLYARPNEPAIWNVDRFAYKGYLRNIGTGRCLSPFAYRKQDRPGNMNKTGYLVYGFLNMVECNETDIENPQRQFRNDYIEATDIQFIYPKDPLGYPEDEFYNGLSSRDYYKTPICPGKLSILMPYRFFEKLDSDTAAQWGCIDVDRLADTVDEKRKLLAQIDPDNSPLLKLSSIVAKDRYDYHPGLCGADRDRDRQDYERRMSEYNAEQRKYEDTCYCRGALRSLSPIFDKNTLKTLKRCKIDRLLKVGESTSNVPDNTVDEKYRSCSVQGQSSWATPQATPATTSCAL
ncbi:hypothetical protein TWF481_002685 [Arthrobotrys musiformis]|uniref:Uncharacterized protein n=1 Tax=Arthrobotrys musiformis TaxID=47236 RepID=A0AAV9VTU4_9PEZI